LISFQVVSFGRSSLSNARPKNPPGSPAKKKLWGEISNLVRLHVIVVVSVRSSRMCFLGSLLRSATDFSSRVTTVSSPVVTTDFTVMTIWLGWLGSSFCSSGGGWIGAATKPYVHWFPSTSGRIFAPHAATALPTGPLIGWSFFFWASVSDGTRRISGRNAALRIRTLGSYGTVAPR
jgi:hypothetical protein